nr:MAG TPA: hypothetical protein [Caudoviricetes sp.]
MLFAFDSRLRFRMVIRLPTGLYSVVPLLA